MTDYELQSIAGLRAGLRNEMCEYARIYRAAGAISAGMPQFAGRRRRIARHLQYIVRWCKAHGVEWRSAFAPALPPVIDWSESFLWSRIVRQQANLHIMAARYASKSL